MKFTAQRTELLNAVKIAIKAVNTTSPLKEIIGLLFEVNENTGLISITGTDVATQITSRIKADHIEEGGSVVLKPIIHDMLKLFDGELVDISTASAYTMNNVVTVKCGKAEYQMPLLDAKSFIKTNMAFPTESIRIQNINSLIQNTVFIANDDSTESSNHTRQYVKLSFAGGGTKAEATDGKCVAIASNPHCADGSLELIIHEKPLKILASLLKADDEVYVGISDKYAVFFNRDMVFQTILYTGNYFDSGKLLSRLSKKYTAVADAKELYGLVNNASAIFTADDDKCINVIFEENKIRMQSATRNGQSSAAINATEVISTSKEGFNFHAKYLLDCLRRTSGPVRITLEEKGFMAINANHNTFLIGPRGPVIIKEAEPIKKQKEAKAKTSKPKTAKKTKTTAKAA